MQVKLLSPGKTGGLTVTLTVDLGSGEEDVKISRRASVDRGLPFVSLQVTVALRGESDPLMMRFTLMVSGEAVSNTQFDS